MSAAAARSELDWAAAKLAADWSARRSNSLICKRETAHDEWARWGRAGYWLRANLILKQVHGLQRGGKPNALLPPVAHLLPHNATPCWCLLATVLLRLQLHLEVTPGLE